MNAIEQYNALVLTRKNNPLPKAFKIESHHIIPRSLEGCDKAWNKVKLLPEEHYMAHYLLTLIYASGDEHVKMVQAWNMSRNSHKEFSMCIGKAEYDRLSKEFCEIAKTYKPTEETRKRISAGLQGHETSPETRRKISEGNTGKHPTEETRKKLSIARRRHESPSKGKKWSLEARMRISEQRKGHYVSEETKRKQSEALKAYFARKKAAG